MDSRKEWPQFYGQTLSTEVKNVGFQDTGLTNKKEHSLRPLFFVNPVFVSIILVFSSSTPFWLFLL